MRRGPSLVLEEERHESVELLRRWCEQRDEAAREELIKRFLPLARKLAHRYQGAHEAHDDLLQVASLGLVQAIDRFDPDRGTAFSTFAVPTILGELKRYFRDVRWSVHVPRPARERALAVENAEQELAATRGHSPTVPELAEYLRLSVEEVLEALETSAARYSVSLDAPHTDDDGSVRTLSSSLADEDARFDQIDEGLAIAAAVKQLPCHEREILHLRFGQDLTQTQIAERTGVSQMQVSRILRRALERLEKLVNGDRQ